jgi:hypothetical protein
VDEAVCKQFKFYLELPKPIMRIIVPLKMHT